MAPELTINRSRIQSIDLLRGIVMIIMALDHTRDFFHRGAFAGDPLNLDTTTPFLYFTRWITHFCAPVFVFLSGVSAWLQSRRKTTKELSIFLLTRGLWLVVVEITIMTFGITGDIEFSFFILQTIWAIGISMIVLGLVIWLPFPVILTLGLLIVFGHNALDFAERERQGNVSLFWNFVHLPTVFPIGGGRGVGIFYPVLPWVGVMMLGYCCGRIFTDLEPGRRSRILLWMGIGLLVLFIALRAANIYGDTGKWSEQKNGLYTFLSFMNVQKYPPSLLYLSVTIGFALVFLATVKNVRSKLASIISVYGRVPFFYYILHFYLLHVFAMIAFLLRGHSFAEGLAGPTGLPKFLIPGEGYGLGIVYAVWIGTVILLYPVCKWYDRYKTNNKHKWWLSYM